MKMFSLSLFFTYIQSILLKVVCRSALRKKKKKKRKKRMVIFYMDGTCTCVQQIEELYVKRGHRLSKKARADSTGGLKTRCLLQHQIALQGNLSTSGNDGATQIALQATGSACEVPLAPWDKIKIQKCRETQRNMPLKLMM